MKFIYLILLSCVLYSSELDSMQEEMQKMRDEFAQMKQTNKDEFQEYQESLNKEYETYKKELQKYWDTPKLSTKKEWISYSKDKKSRSDVDFEKNILIVETIAPNEQQAKKQLQKRLSYAVGKNTKEVVDTDTLQQRISKLPKTPFVFTAKVDAKPILSTVIFKKPPTKKVIENYAKKVIKKSKIEIKKSKVKHQKIYKIKIALPKNTTIKRSKIYKNDVFKNAERFNIPKHLVFAIIQTESNFNPFAKSHIPAFGLMQIVPTSAGKDVYRFLYKKKGMPSVTYLYNGKNNIKMGTTYLHILYYRYLKRIKNPQSRLYCSIAAYNTGAGNIAWAFTKSYSMKKAAPIINALTPDEVYAHLLSDLRFDEPKNYLKRVNKRMAAFKKAYNLH